MIEWLAGFLDGEGSISISKTGYPAIYLYQKDPAILIEVQKIYGGRLSEKFLKSLDSQGDGSFTTGSKTRKMHQLVWNGQNAVELASKLIPFIRVKKDKISKVLEYHPK